MGITPELIERINELARKKKDGTITETEVEEQAKLRKEYIEGIKDNFRGTLDNVDIVDEINISNDEIAYEEIKNKLENETGIVGIVNKDGNTIIAYKAKEIDKNAILGRLKD